MTMFLISLVTALMVLLTTPWSSANFCSRVQSLDFIQPGRRLTDHVFQTSQISTAIQCAVMCYMTSKCKSYNFNKLLGICEWNDEDMTPQSGEVDFVFGTRSEVPMSLVGPCAGHTCLPTETCLPISTGYKCLSTDTEIVINCGPAPSVAYADVAYNNTTYPTVATYQCQPISVYLGGSTSSTCSADGTWTVPTLLCTAMFISSTAMSKTDGQAYCITNGKNLLTIQSTAHADIYNNYLQQNDVHDSVWVGLEYNVYSSKFVWSDGQEFNGEDLWDTNEPREPETKNCVVKRGHDRKLHTKECSQHIKVLCVS